MIRLYSVLHCLCSYYYYLFAIMLTAVQMACRSYSFHSKWKFESLSRNEIKIHVTATRNAAQWCPREAKGPQSRFTAAAPADLTPQCAYDAAKMPQFQWIRRGRREKLAKWEGKKEVSLSSAQEYRHHHHHHLKIIRWVMKWKEKRR